MGSAGSLLPTRFVRGMLYGMTPTVPSTDLELGLLLLAVSALDAYLSARRASRVEPVAALPGEG